MKAHKLFTKEKSKQEESLALDTLSEETTSSSQVRPLLTPKIVAEHPINNGSVEVTAVATASQHQPLPPPPTPPQFIAEELNVITQPPNVLYKAQASSSQDDILETQNHDSRPAAAPSAATAAVDNNMDMENEFGEKRVGFNVNDDGLDDEILYSEFDEQAKKMSKLQRR